MRSDAWKCDTCASTALLHGNPAVEGWFELVRHFDDGFTLTTDVQHFCSVTCLATRAVKQAA